MVSILLDIRGLLRLLIKVVVKCSERLLDGSQFHSLLRSQHASLGCLAAYIPRGVFAFKSSPQENIELLIRKVSVMQYNSTAKEGDG